MATAFLTVVVTLAHTCPELESMVTVAVPVIAALPAGDSLEPLRLAVNVWGAADAAPAVKRRAPLASTGATNAIDTALGIITNLLAAATGA